MNVEPCVTGNKPGFKVVKDNRILAAASRDFIEFLAERHMTSKNLMLGLRNDPALDKLIVHRVYEKAREA